MSDETNKVPDHSLQGSKIPASDEPPEVYAVTDLRAYVKPDLAEELGSATGGLANCGTETLCTCVPVETCACNLVTYGSCAVNPSICSCEGNCGYGLYWFPY